LLSSKVSGIIFDLDNTLVSSSLDFTQIRQAINCPAEQDILSFVDSLPIPQQSDARQEILHFEMLDAQNATILPGTENLLKLLNSRQIPCAIVTRNCKQAALLKIQNNNIDIPLLLTRENSKAKPAPDSVYFIANHWQQPPGNILFVGDHLYDIQTAINAQAMSCLINYGSSLPYEDLADLVLKNLSELTSTLIDLIGLADTNEVL
jgi:HAD superfamily hydrolase (TIGR01549 family)